MRRPETWEPNEVPSGAELRADLHASSAFSFRCVSKIAKKATFSFGMSVCLSVLVELGSHWDGFS